MNRRTFLTQTSTLAAGVSLLSHLPAQAATVTRPGLQLYSLRDDMEKDARGTLKQVAGMGYREIETYPGSKGFLWGMKPAEYRAYLTDLGLEATAAHCGLQPDMQPLIDEAAGAGMQYLIVSFIREDRRPNLDGYRRVAEEFNRIGEMTKKAGVQFAYHNHDYPFKPLEGQIPYDVLLTNTDQNLVGYELDLFWIIEPGQDPIAYFRKYPGRFPAVHVKDRSRNDPKHSTVVGEGNFDLAALFKAGQQAGVKHHFVEQEEYETTPLASVKACCDNLKKIRF
jgi:sugar phosphate isomerase/epimerase